MGNETGKEAGGARRMKPYQDEQHAHKTPSNDRNQQFRGMTVNLNDQESMRPRSMTPNASHPRNLHQQQQGLGKMKDPSDWKCDDLLQAETFCCKFVQEALNIKMNANVLNSANFVKPSEVCNGTLRSN